MRGLFIIGAWLLLHAPLLAWFGRTFSHTSFRLNAFLLIGAASILAWRVRRAPLATLSLVPRQNRLALLLAALCGGLGLISRRFIDVQMIEAPLFLLGTWAVLGLFAERSAWRRALVPTLVFISVLPFGAQADAYAGFMARVFSAKVAASILGAFGAPSMSAETVLVFENGIAQIDAPCSGLRSLWMGAVVFLMALWVEGRRLGLAAAAGFVLLLALLITANVVRVVLIIAVAVVLEQPVMAEIIHVPVGLIGFCLAIAAPLWLLHLGHEVRPPPTSLNPSPALSRRFALALSLLMVLGGLFSSPRPVIARAPGAYELSVPAEWKPERIELTSAESDLLARFAQGRVAKLRLSMGSARAAVLFVESHSWRSHHPPELCLAGSGHQLHDVSEQSITDDFAIRFARLDDGSQHHASWFQSGETTHADLVDRILAQFSGPGASFVMISVVTDGFDGPHDPAFIQFLTELRARVARAQKESSS